MPQARRRTVGNGLIAAVTTLALCLGTWLLSQGTKTHGPPQPSAAQAAPAHPHRPRAARRGPLSSSPPDRIRIPRSGWTHR